MIDRRYAFVFSNSLCLSLSISLSTFPLLYDWIWLNCQHVRPTISRSQRYKDNRRNDHCSCLLYFSDSTRTMGHSRAITTITPGRVNGERGRRVSCFISMPHALRKGGYIAAAKSSRFEQILLSAYRLKFLHDSGFASILHSNNLYSVKVNETRALVRARSVGWPGTTEHESRVSMLPSVA